MWSYNGIWQVCRVGNRANCKEPEYEDRFRKYTEGHLERKKDLCWIRSCKAGVSEKKVGGVFFRKPRMCLMSIFNQEEDVKGTPNLRRDQKRLKVNAEMLG